MILGQPPAPPARPRLVAWPIRGLTIISSRGRFRGRLIQVFRRMTIGEYLHQKAATFSGSFVFLAALALLLKWLPLSDRGLAVGALAVLTTLVLLFIALALRFRCPRCKGPLSSLVAHFGPFRGLGRKVQCCPLCSVPMDEPL